MAPLLKWPAFARRIYDARARGADVRRVDVFFGAPWPDKAQLPATERDGPYWPHLPIVPVIGVPVRDYRPGAFDLRVLAGMAVKIHAPERMPELEDWPLTYWLAADCARVAAYVLAPSCIGCADHANINALATWAREPHPTEHRFIFPRWWPDELEMSYRARSEAWLKAWDDERTQRRPDAEARAASAERSRRRGSALAPGPVP